MFPLSVQILRTTSCCAVKSHSRVLATFQSNGKTCKQEAISMKCYFVRILIILYIYYIIHKVCNSLRTPLTHPKIMMLTKKNICSVQNYLGGNTDPQLFETDKQNVDVASLEKFLRTPMNDSAFSFSLFVTFVLSLITNCLFLSVFLISVAK